MNDKELIIAVHCNTSEAERFYGVVEGFSQGLIKGFVQSGVKAYSTEECFEKDIPFNLAIGFDSADLKHWQKILNQKINNIMWSVDSVFIDNYKIVKNFAAFPNFIVFESSQADLQSTSTYMPTLKHGYIPHAVDLDLFHKKNVEKENDFVFFSSICDYEQIIENLKSTMPESVFNLIMDMQSLCLKNPSIGFWQVSQAVCQACELKLDAEQYMLLFKNVTDLVTNQHKIKTIQALSDYDVKIYGNGPWEKYISGKVKYMGSCSYKESAEILQKSKIALHVHPFSLCSGLHTRVLNAAATETFVLSTNTLSLNLEFGDTLGYFDNKTFDDVSQKAEYFLNNEDERQEKALNAYEIVSTKHTWNNRAKSILEIVSF